MGCVMFLTRFPFTLSLVLFCCPFLSSFPPLFLPLACLFSDGANNAAAWPLTLANDGGRFMWKVPLRTVSIRSLNWRILSLTWVWELCAVLHDLSQHWTCLSIAKRNLVAKKLSNAIWSLKLFLFLPIMVSSWLRFDMQTLSLPKRLLRLLWIVGCGFQVYWNWKVHEPIASTMLWFCLKISFDLLLESGGR